MDSFQAKKKTKIRLGGKRFKLLPMLVVAALFAATGAVLFIRSEAAISWPLNAQAIQADICGNASYLTGPASAPAGATTVPSGDNSGFNFSNATTYWFAPGTHTGISNVHPRSGTVFIGAPGAIVDGGNNLKVFATTLWYEGSTQFTGGLTIRYLTVQNYNPDPQHAAVGQDGGPDLTIENSTLKDIHRGAAIMAGPNNVFRYNCMTNNGQYAINAYSINGNVVNLTVEHNEISYNDKDDADAATGLGASGGIKFWAVNGARVNNNWVHHNKGGAGLWMDTNNNDFLVEKNLIELNEGKGVWYEIGYNLTMRNNSFIKNTWQLGPRQSLGGVPEAAVYLAHASGTDDPRFPHTITGQAKVEIANNYFLDNFNGISAYESADRFCGRNDTSDCPNGTTQSVCTAPGINSEPLYSNCRWQTKNVSIHNNEFRFTKANVPGCTGNVICGWQAVFSNWGNFAPYNGYKVADSIVGKQNIVFANNSYYGDWVFFSYMQSETDVSIIPFSTWQAGGSAKAHDGHTFTRAAQDAGSTFNGSSTTPPAPPTTTTPPPSTPASMTTSNVQQTSVSLSWGASVSGAGIGGYYVYRNGQQVADVKTTSYTDSGLMAGTTYSYAVKAYDISTPPNISAASNSVSVTTLAATSTTPPVVTPPAPTPDNGSVVAAKTFESSQEKLNGWYGDTVTLSSAQSHGGAYSLAVTATAPQWGVIEDWSGSRIESGKAYDFSLWVFAGSKPSTVTARANWIGTGSSSLGAATIGSTATTVGAWVELKGSLTAPSGALAVAFDITSNGATTGDTFYFDDITIKTKDATPAPQGPEAPALTSVKATSSATVEVQWSAAKSPDSTAITGYYVFRNGTNITPKGVNALNFIDAGLLPSTTYEYAVSAVDARGLVSAPSAKQAATTPAPADTTPPSTPANFKASAVNSTQINLTWTPSTDDSGVKGYYVYLKLASGASQRVGSVATTSFGVAGLTPSTKYDFYVEAYDTAGNISVSTPVVSATTLQKPTGTLFGVVYDGKTTKGIAGALIRSDDTATAKGVVRAYTNRNGQYVLPGIIVGAPHSYFVRASGYKSAIVTEAITGSVLRKNIGLLKP